MSLKETLENTIINNVECEITTDFEAAIMDYESVSRTAGYIEEEMKANMIEFADYILSKRIEAQSEEYYRFFVKRDIAGYAAVKKSGLLEEFLTNKYKKE